MVNAISLSFPLTPLPQNIVEVQHHKVKSLAAQTRSEFFFVEFGSISVGNNKEFFLFFGSESKTNGFQNTWTVLVVFSRKKNQNQEIKMTKW